jgi:ABC-type amino acid transport system permease subunit
MAGTAKENGARGYGPTAARWVRRAARGLWGAIVETRKTLISFVIVIAIAAAFIVALAELGIIELDFIFRMWSTGYGPLRTTLILTVASFIIGFFGAMPLGLIRASRAAPVGGRKRATLGQSRSPLRMTLYGLATAYVGAIRGTPFLVQLYVLVYFFLAVAPRLTLLGEDLYFWIGLTALSVNTIGYQAEVFRAGFQSIGQGQVEAGRAIGLRGRQIFLHIRLPQAVRLILLPLTNEFISQLKTSTIVSYIAVYEIFHWSEDMGQKFGHPIEGFLMISIFYLLINVPVSRIVSYVEQKKRIPGLGTPVREGRKGRRGRPSVVADGRTDGVATSP